MNVEKEVTLSELKGKFTKDFDTIGKMDVFLEFTVGKCMAKTETAQEAGKEPVWKDDVVLTYFDQNQITVKAYDEDITENEFIGSVKLQIKSLRFPGGLIEFSIIADNGENMGTISGKYTIKNLQSSPLILLKNFRVELVKETNLFLKARPYLQFTADEVCMTTEPKGEVLGTSMTWGQNLRFKIKENSKITIELFDKDDTNSHIFQYECSAKEFRLTNGSKKFHVHDKKYNQLGLLCFDYETVSLVSKQQSVKNAQKLKKAQNELLSVTVQKMTVDLASKHDIDVYYRLIVGNSEFKSEVISKTPKISTIEINKCLYSQAKENKIIVAVFEKGLLTDDLIGVGHIPLENLGSGEKNVTLVGGQNSQEIGIATLLLTSKHSPCKSLILEKIAISVSEEGDLIGNPEPYLVVKAGCCSARTQTGNQIKMTFKRNIELKFVEEETIDLQIWDEDVGSSSLMYSENVPLSTFKASKGDYSISMSRVDGKGEDNNKGSLSFKYEIKGSVPESPAKSSIRKVTQKQTETNISKPGDLTTREIASKKEIKEINTAREKSAADLEKQLNQKHVVPVQSEKPENERNASLNMNRSKGSLNLPSIITSFHQVYGDRIFDKQSAATLQRTIVAYSMPKGNRFINEPKYTGEPSYCLDSCFKLNSTKGAGFGFGRKKQFPEWMERNMKQNPAPGTYFDSNYGLKSRGPTFGIGHKHYERVMIPREQKPLQGNMARKLSPIRDPLSK